MAKRLPAFVAWFTSLDQCVSIFAIPTASVRFVKKSREGRFGLEDQEGGWGSCGGGTELPSPPASESGKRCNTNICSPSPLTAFAALYFSGNTYPIYDTFIPYKRISYITEVDPPRRPIFSITSGGRPWPVAELYHSATRQMEHSLLRRVANLLSKSRLRSSSSSLL